MNKQRITAILLCLITCAACILSACGRDEELSLDTGSSAAPESSTDTEVGDYFSKYPFTYNKKNFHLCITSNEAQTTYFCEDIVPGLYSTTDEALNDAVIKRNELINQKTGVEITADAVKNVSEALRLDVKSGSSNYDAAIPFMREATSLAQESAFYDLYEFKDILHFDSPWWDKSAEESLSIGNRLYFTTGDISIMQKIVSIAVTVNKNMMKTYFDGVDIYQLVRDKQWTFDKMIEMCEAVTADTDGTPGMSENDTWGVSAEYADSSAFFLGSGYSYIEKDNNDIPYLAFGSEATVSLAQKILEKLQLKDDWVFHCDPLPSNTRWVTSLAIFGENRALFRNSAFSAIKKLRAYPECDDFGIIPLPLMTETQTDYATYCNCKFAYCVVIPTSLSREDAEFSAYMLDAMAWGGRKFIVPAYYDVILKYRDFKDQDSEDMLDNYIFNNIVYDLGNVYDFGGVQSMFDELMRNQSTNVASTLEGKKSAIESAIEECLMAYGVK